MSRLNRVSVLVSHMVAFKTEPPAREAMIRLASAGFECDVMPPEVEDASEHGGCYSDEWIVTAARRYIAPDILTIDEGRPDEEQAVREVTDPLGGRYEGGSINAQDMEDIEGDESNAARSEP